MDINNDNKKLPPRPRWQVLVGRTIIFMTTISFLSVGLVINILQLMILLALRVSSNRKWKLHLKQLNGELLKILFAPPICLLYYWSRLSLDIQLDDIKLIEESKQPMLAIMIPNHSYEVDYFVCFALADQLGNMGAYKSMSKDELKYLPVCGWALWMSDIIFVKRTWIEDKKVMGEKLNQLLDYEQSMLGVFAEGTRWTEEKHRQSEKFALSRGIKPFKHHLVPRKRGFNYTIRHYLMEINNNKRLDEKLFRLFNMQIIMPDRPRFKNFLDGDQLRAHIYCEEVRISPEIREEVLNSKDQDDCPKLTQFLYDTYRRKDEIVDDFYANGNRFSVNRERGGPFPYKRAMFPLVVWISGFCSTYLIFGYLAVTHFSQSITFWSLVIGFVIGCLWIFKRIAKESKTPRPLSSSKRTQEVGQQPAVIGTRSDRKTVTFKCPMESDSEVIDEVQKTKTLVRCLLENNNNNGNRLSSSDAY